MRRLLRRVEPDRTNWSVGYELYLTKEIDDGAVIEKESIPRDRDYDQSLYLDPLEVKVVSEQLRKTYG